MTKEQIKAVQAFIQELGDSHRGIYIHKVNFDGSYTTFEAISQSDMSWMLTNATIRLQELIKQGPRSLIELGGPM